MKTKNSGLQDAATHQYFCNPSSSAKANNVKKKTFDICNPQKHTYGIRRVLNCKKRAQTFFSNPSYFTQADS